MSKTIMIQGTASNAGKSLIVAGLCRIFMKDGHRVVPFKSQNMALNSFVTESGLEMGRAQVMQAEACKVLPDVRMNPILLKPTGEGTSQVIVNGEAIGNVSAKEYFKERIKLTPQILKAFKGLSEENEIIVLEGAGSPAEINLKENDIVNMGMAKMAKAPVLLVGDIDRGGVFASLLGTVMLLEPSEKKYIKGIIVNKFRGDLSILQPGIKTLEDMLQIPVVGIVPHMDLKVDDEDSLTDRFLQKNNKNLVDIAVIRLPHISNFTDFNPLEYIEGVSLRYVGFSEELGDPDLIILPGTKNTMEDLLALRNSGIEASILEFSAKDKPIIGICGGFQMLGRKISDPQNTEHGGTLAGIGLLPFETIFTKEKVRTQKNAKLSSVTGIFKDLSGMLCSGYEIHMGLTEMEGNFVNRGNVYGTYFHGLFDKESIAKEIVSSLMLKKGLDTEGLVAYDIESFKQGQYDILEENLRLSLDMDKIYRILDQGIAD